MQAQTYDFDRNVSERETVEVSCSPLLQVSSHSWLLVVLPERFLIRRWPARVSPALLRAVSSLYQEISAWGMKELHDGHESP